MKIALNIPIFYIFAIQRKIRFFNLIIKVYTDSFKTLTCRSNYERNINRD